MLYRKILLFLTLIFATTIAFANDSEYHHTVDDTDIYLGIVPAQQTKNQKMMHGGIKKDAHLYHIVIALFDHRTGKRITNAKLRATVASLGMTGETKQLEPMHDDVISYGNYFIIYHTSPYTVKVTIERPEKKQTTITRFTVSP